MIGVHRLLAPEQREHNLSPLPEISLKELFIVDLMLTQMFWRQEPNVP
jgi:hypothetical protein